MAEIPLAQDNSQSINVAPEGALTMQIMPSIIKVYCITEEQLETIASLSLSNSIHLSFLGMSFGALVTLLVALETVSTLSDINRAMFIVATLTAMFLVALCGVLFAFGFRRSKASIERIKARGFVTPMSQ
ncbi:MAG: hypothetical protein WBW33_09430 [Bryobacteraceae bacterium]